MQFSCRIKANHFFFTQEQPLKSAEPNMIKRFTNFINAVKDLEDCEKEEQEHEKKSPEGMSTN